MLTFTLENREGLKVLAVGNRQLLAVSLDALRASAEARTAWATLVAEALFAEEVRADAA